MRIGRLSGSAVLFAVLIPGVGLGVMAWRLLSSDEPRVAADTPPVAPLSDEWATYEHAKTDITIEYPALWRVDPRLEGSIAGHLSAPDEAVHLFVTAFIGGQSLEEFAKSKFEAQPETFRGAGPAKKMEGPGWQGLVQEADDIREGRKDQTRRVVLCAVHGDLHVALALYLDPKEFTPKQAYYERLFSSLRFTGKVAQPSPRAHHH